jgi:hypothetical protein
MSMKNIASFPKPESGTVPTPKERYDAEHTWEVLREQAAQDTLSLLELAAFKPEDTLDALISRYEKETNESFEARAVQNLKLLVADHVLKFDMTVGKAIKILERTADVKIGKLKDMGVERIMDAELKQKREHIPDLKIDPEAMYEKLANVPEGLRDDMAIAREIETMEEDLGKSALRWELMNSALRGLENIQSTFKNSDLAISQAIIALRGRVDRGDRGKSLQLLQKLEDLIALRLLKRSMTIPGAIEFLKHEVAKEPKLLKLKEKE